MKHYGFTERLLAGLTAIALIFAGIAVGIAKTVFGFFLPPLEAVYEIMRFVIFGWRR